MLERNSLIQRFKKKSTPVPLALESDITTGSQLSNPFKIIPGFLGNVDFAIFNLSVLYLIKKLFSFTYAVQAAGCLCAAE